MSAIEFVKKHPVGVGVGVVGVLALFVFAGVGGGSGEPAAASGTSDAEIAAGMQMQQLQYASQAQQYQVGAEREVALASTSAGLELGKLQIMAQQKSDELAATLGLAQINANQQTTSLTSTLYAQTEQARIDSDKQQNAAMLATIVRQSELQASTSIAAINSQVQIAQINKPKRGLFSAIFG